MKKNKLLEAIRNCDIEAMEQLIREGTAVSQANKHGQTPLYLAIQYDHVDAIELLIRALVDGGHDLSQQGCEVSTLLLYAARMGHYQAVQLLIGQGACIHRVNDQYNDPRFERVNNKDNFKGYSPLALAAQNGHIEVMKFLIEEGADVHQEGDGCYIPFFTAAENGHVPAMELLLKHGVYFNLPSGNGFTPFDIASQNGHADAMDLLLKLSLELKVVIHVDAIDNTGRTWLYYATEKHYVEAMRVLVGYGADVNKASFDGTIPLFAAAKNGHMDAVFVLMEDGRGVNHANKIGETPLHFAAKNGHVRVCKWLLDHGAIVNKKASYERTPLEFAVDGSHYEAVKLLLDHGAEFGGVSLLAAARNGCEPIVRLLVDGGDKIDKANKDGETALHIAAKNGHEEIVFLLLENEADPEKVTNIGWSPLMLAIENGHERVAELLINCGTNDDLENEDGNKLLFLAAKKGFCDAVLRFIQSGADVTKANNDGKTPLLIAIEHGHYEVVVSLLDLEQLSDSGSMALLVAAYYSQVDIMNYIIDSLDVDINSANESGVTPILIAAYNGSFEVLDVLLKYGVDINQKSRYETTPLALAVKQGHVYFAKELLVQGAQLNYSEIDQWLPRNNSEFHKKNQNTHDTAVTCSVHQCVNRLKERYDGKELTTAESIEGLITDLLDLDNTITSFKETYSEKESLTADEIKQFIGRFLAEFNYGHSASKAISQLLNDALSDETTTIDTTEFNSMLDDWKTSISNSVRNFMSRVHTEPKTRFDLTLAQCLALVWKACGDVNALVEGQTPDDELILDRKKSLIKHMIDAEIQYRGGMCLEGRFNQIVDSQTRRHPDVVIHYGLDEYMPYQNKSIIVREFNALSFEAQQDVSRYWHPHANEDGSESDPGSDSSTKDFIKKTTEKLFSEFSAMGVPLKVICAYVSMFEDACCIPHPDQIEKTNDTDSEDDDGEEKEGNELGGEHIKNDRVSRDRVGHVNLGSSLRLLSAVERNDIDSVAVLLSAGAYVNISGNNNMSPLITAARNDYVEIMTLLLDAGADISQVNDKGWTPLMAAARYGKVDAIKMLVPLDNDLDRENNDGYTALVMAASYEHVEVMQLLIGRDINIDHPGINGNTPLLMATAKNRIEAMRLLLDSGADIHRTDDKGYSPIILAAAKNKLDAIELLLLDIYDTRVNEPNAVNGDTPVYSAAKRGHADAMRMLYINGADIFKAKLNGDTPLDIAAENGHVEALEVLFEVINEKGVNVNEVYGERATPLFFAVKNGHCDAVTFLLKCRLNIDHICTESEIPLQQQFRSFRYPSGIPQWEKDRISSNYKNTFPLFLATEYNQVDVIQLLLLYVADANQATPGELRSSLMLAAEKGNRGAVGALLNGGADVTQMDDDGNTALIYAAKENHVDVMEMLLEAGAEVDRVNNNGWSPFHLATQHGHTQAMDKLLDYGADVNQINEMTEKESPLYMAVKSGNESIVEFLISKGANVHQQQFSGETPLMAAVKSRQFTVVKLLIEGGANVNDEDEYGDTPLIFAAHDGDKDTIKYLIKNGADVFHTGLLNLAPEQICNRFGHHDAEDIIYDKIRRIQDRQFINMPEIPSTIFKSRNRLQRQSQGERDQKGFSNKP